MSLAIRTLFVITLALYAGCGPSATAIKQSREAHYSCAPGKVFATVAQLMARKYPPLEVANPATGIVISGYRWHNKHGMRLKVGAAVVQDEAVQFSIALKVEQRPKGVFIGVQPRVLLFDEAIGTLRPVSPDHAAWPQWATGQTDKLMLSIYSQLEECAIPKTNTVEAQPAPQSASGTTGT